MANERKHTYVVGAVDDIPPGHRKVVHVDGRSIGVFNIDGAFYALLNRCPHQAAPLCEGRVVRTTLPSRPGEYVLSEKADIIRCPWLGWEFHIPSGESIFDPFRCRVRTYEVTVQRNRAEVFSSTDDDETWPKAETFPVTVDADQIILHLRRRRKDERR